MPPDDNDTHGSTASWRDTERRTSVPVTDSYDAGPHTAPFNQLFGISETVDTDCSIHFSDGLNHVPQMLSSANHDDFGDGLLNGDHLHGRGFDGDFQDIWDELIDCQSIDGGGDVTLGNDCLLPTTIADQEAVEAEAREMLRSQESEMAAMLAELGDTDRATVLQLLQPPSASIADPAEVERAHEMLRTQQGTSSDTPKLDGGDTTDADAEGSDFEEEEQLHDDIRSSKLYTEASRQCEQKAECSRPARRVAGKYGGKRLCLRHGDQYEVNNSGPPTWQPIVVPTDDALAAIRPNIKPPPSYRDPAEDPSLSANKDGLQEWTLRFHHAAMTPYVGEGPDREDPQKLMVHQDTFTKRAKSRGHKGYRDRMIGVRISLLFPIALRYHQGGEAIYCIGGDNAGYREDSKLSFEERLETIETVLTRNKKVVMDVIEGRGVEAFVRDPRQFDKRKTTNKKGNVARQERVEAEAAGSKARSGGAQPSATPTGKNHLPPAVESSRLPAIVVDSPSPPPRTSRRRKRAVDDEADVDANVPEQPALPPQRKKAATRQSVHTRSKPVAASPMNDKPPIGTLQFGPTVPDTELFSARQISSDAHNLRHGTTGSAVSAFGRVSLPAQRQYQYPNPAVQSSPASP